MASTRQQSGFSLVELSIVLVILGLLVGGVLAGQSLIRAAELRAVTTEVSRYTAAVKSFRDKYFALPGDMSNATASWGKDAVACNGHSGSVSTPGTCNGNGDGIIFWGSAANATAERNQFWKQLALSGLIEGSYSGTSGPNGAIEDTTLNTPQSRLVNARWSILYSRPGFTAFANNIFDIDYGNALRVGRTVNTTYAHESVMTTEEAWNIDTKMDDGRPGTGSVIANMFNICSNASNATDFSAAYRLNQSGLRCALSFVRAAE